MYFESYGHINNKITYMYTSTGNLSGEVLSNDWCISVHTYLSDDWNYQI